MLEIAKRIDNDWKIHVVGDGADKQKFKDLIANASLDEKIILHGNLVSDELREFYSNGSIFISTSRWEGFGLSIIEAMGSGLPIVSFGKLGPSEIKELFLQVT